jgi:hypothetical protein
MYKWHPQTNFDVNTWYQKLLGTLLVACHSLWTIRNGEQHGTEQTQKCTRRAQQPERDLHNLFRFKATELEIQIIAEDIFTEDCHHRRLMRDTRKNPQTRQIQK